MIKNIYTVILSGGFGTRLWPISKKNLPKQFLNFNKFTIFQETIKRHNFLTNKNKSNMIIITNENHRFIVKKQLLDLNINNASIILEKYPRNTAPAATLSALCALELSKNEKSNDPILIICPSDHIIKNKNNYSKVLNNAIKFAELDYLVLLGIKPQDADENFGYIEYENGINFDEFQIFNIKNFIEKPNKNKAKEFVALGNYFWNSGIYIVKASLWIKIISEFEKNIYILTKQAFDKKNYDNGFIRINDIYKTNKSISIDYAVSEKCPKSKYKIGVLDLQNFWTDLGNWKSFYDYYNTDENDNFIDGKNIINSSLYNSLVINKRNNHLLVIENLKDLNVIVSDNATLISKRNKNSEIKNIINSIKDNFLNSNIEYRPWGKYENIYSEKGYLIKKIILNPGSSISLQSHSHRSEHWIVLSGHAQIELNDKIFFLNLNESTFIPKNSKHRLTNCGDDLLIIIELQIGEKISESDITRYEDLYGRK